MNELAEQRQYLRILSIFHYVVAFFAAMLACLPVLHLTIGISMLFGGLGQMQGQDALFAIPFGLMFTLIPAVLILAGWAYAIALALAGYYLSQHRHYTYCLVMAGLSTAFTPFGTVLGVFTLILLLQPETKTLFGRGANRPAAPAPEA